MVVMATHLQYSPAARICGAGDAGDAVMIPVRQLLVIYDQIYVGILTRSVILKEIHSMKNIGENMEKKLP